MPIDELPQIYPRIHQLHQAAGGGWGVMEQLFEDANMSLPALDAALGRVSPGNGAVLSGLASDLFSNDLGKALAAICEFLAFGWLATHAGLTQEDIGYPADWEGEDPPFEGVLRHSDQELAFDVKDGSGSGVSLLRDLLQRQIDAHPDGANQAPRIHVGVNAPTGQRWVNENFNQIIRPFRDELRDNGLAARSLRYEAGAGYVQVGIDTRVGGSIIGVREKASFVALQIVDHAQHKAQQLPRTGAGSFLLVYVRRPGSGLSDFSEETVASAADFLAGRGDLPGSFSGVLFLDFDHGHDNGPKALWWERNGTPWSLWNSHVRAYVATPTITPEARSASAQGLDPAQIKSAGMVLMGSCEVRGPNCLAPGSAGSVFVFFHQDEQYVSCQRCRDDFGWPGPQDSTDADRGQSK